MNTARTSSRGQGILLLIGGAGLCLAVSIALVVNPFAGFLSGLLLATLLVLALHHRLFHFLVFVVFFELILGGSGRYIEISDLLSPRKALFVFIWLLFLVLWLYDSRKPAFPIRSFRSSWFASVLAIATVLLFGLGLGLLRGNNMEFVVGDSQGFIFLTLAIPLCYFARRGKISVEFFLWTFLGATSLYGLLKGIVYFGVQLGYIGGAFLADLIQETTNQLVLINLTASEYRINSVGDAFLMFGLPILVGVASSVRRRSAKLAAIAGVLSVLVGLVASDTRALWLGAILGLVVLVVLAGLNYKLKITAWILAGIFVSSLAFPGIFRNTTSRLSTAFDTSEFGNALRVRQMNVLFSMAREHPVLGHGFGSIAPEVSLHPDKPYVFEMETVAFYMKMGIVGCAAWAALFGWLLLTLVKMSRSLPNPLHAMVARALCGGIVGILFAGSTNPWLSVAVGMGTCAFIVVVADLLRQQIATPQAVAKAASTVNLALLGSMAQPARFRAVPARQRTMAGRDY